MEAGAKYVEHMKGAVSKNLLLKDKKLSCCGELMEIISSSFQSLWTKYCIYNEISSIAPSYIVIILLIFSRFTFQNYLISLITIQQLISILDLKCSPVEPIFVLAAHRGGPAFKSSPERQSLIKQYC